MHVGDAFLRDPGLARLPECRPAALTALSPQVIIFVTVFIDLLGFGIIIPLLPFYAETFGASAFVVGMLTTVFSLMQFLFACDRGNPELIGRYDVLSPPALCFLRELVERCRRAGVSLSICGEMASRPLEAMVLLGLGVRQLSLVPADIGPVKAMIRSLRCGRLAAYLAHLYDLPDHSVRVRLRNYALDHGVQLHI